MSCPAEIEGKNRNLKDLKDLSRLCRLRLEISKGLIGEFRMIFDLFQPRVL